MVMRHTLRPLTSLMGQKYLRRFRINWQIRKTDEFIYLATRPYYIRRNNKKFARRGKFTLGLHTVFIARENILFLEEWILYHKNLGVEYFYLYDNSEVQTTKDSISETGGIAGKIAKRNVHYNEILTMTDEDVQNELDRLVKTIPGVRITKWSPRDKEGKIHYGQTEAANQVLQQVSSEIDWLILMDVDEFLVPNTDLDELCMEILSKGYPGALFPEKPMDSRFNHLDQRVTDINLTCPYHGKIDLKMLLHIPDILSINSPHTFNSISGPLVFDEKKLHHRHYRCHSDPATLVEIEPLSSQCGRDPEWKLNNVVSDWKHIMEATTIPERCSLRPPERRWWSIK